MNTHPGFRSEDYAGIFDPVLLQGERMRAVRRARGEAARRLKEAHPEEYDAIYAEEFAAMEGEFARRLEATARKVARERGAA
jgi:hypothetical protein